MLKEVIEKIIDLSHARPFEVDGRQYTTKPIHPVKEPVAETVILGTLTGLADYLKADADKINPAANLIHVESFQSVALISSCAGRPFRQREKLIHAAADNPKFPFGQFMDVESFIIRLQSQFVQTDQTVAILRVVGNVTDSAVKQFSDDGVTQQVTAKAGVSRVQDLPVPNPVILAPFRTFLEIEQPESKFVFRMRSGDPAPTCAIFEADGGAWKNEAVRNIKGRLEFHTKDIAVIA